MQDPSFRRAVQKYARVRGAAFELVRGDAVASALAPASLRLTDCDAHTLAVWRATWQESHPSGSGGWNWERLIRQAWKNPPAFRLAIWSGSQLCGLSVGRVSRADTSGARQALSIDFIESARDPNHPLRRRIGFLTTAAADAYGRALGAAWLRLIDPLPGVIPLYENLGFTVVRDQPRLLYCERRISQ